MYPAELEADVVLADGGTVHVRPIRPDDGGRILALGRPAEILRPDLLESLFRARVEFVRGDVQ